MNIVNEVLNKQEKQIRHQWLSEFQDPVEEDKRLMRKQNEAYFLNLKKKCLELGRFKLSANDEYKVR
jgi:hypothetical protein